MLQRRSASPAEQPVNDVARVKHLFYYELRLHNGFSISFVGVTPARPPARCRPAPAGSSPAPPRCVTLQRKQRGRDSETHSSSHRSAALRLSGWSEAQTSARKLGCSEVRSVSSLMETEAACLGRVNRRTARWRTPLRVADGSVPSRLAPRLGKCPPPAHASPDTPRS